MGVRVLRGDEGSVLYCSVSLTAFGPVFAEDEDPDDFLEWLDRHYGEAGYDGAVDARQLTEAQLAEDVAKWRRQVIRSL